MELQSGNASLWDILVCPEGCGRLNLTIFESKGSTIESGILRCPQDHVYPIVAGIPRMLPDALLHHREFCRRFEIKTDNSKLGRLPVPVRSTQTSFSNWWLRVVHGHFYEENGRAWLRARTGMEPEFFRNRMVLDAGCGNGRLTHPIGEAGAGLVVGMDLGIGVEKAAKHCQALPNVVFVQGNLMQPPFCRETFDSILSIGVLHHTPAPEKSFRALAKLIRHGGTLSVYLYRRLTPSYDRLSRSSLAHIFNLLTQTPIHASINRMPHKLVLAFSYLLWYRRCWIEQVRRISSLSAAVLERIPPRDSYAPHEGRELNVIRNYDYYSARYNHTHSLEEVIEWYREAGFGELIATPYPLSVTGTNVGQTKRDPLNIRYYAEHCIDEVETILGDEQQCHSLTHDDVLEKTMSDGMAQA